MAVFATKYDLQPVPRMIVVAQNNYWTQPALLPCDATYLMDHSSKKKLPKILVYTESFICVLHGKRHYRTTYK